MRKKSFKIEVTPEAHKAAKIHCAFKEINVKDYVSDLILRNSDKITENYLARSREIKDKEQGAHSEKENLILEYISSNPSTPQQISSVLAISEIEVNKILKDLYEQNKIECEERNNEHIYWVRIKAGGSTSKVYGNLMADPDRARTAEEIAKQMPSESRQAIQNALYWLLNEHLIDRRIRESPIDRRKDSWEYWRTSDREMLTKRGIEISDILNVLPDMREEAMAVSDIAFILRAPKSTIRDTLKRYEKSEELASFKSTTKNNKPTTKYYKIHNERRST